MNIIPYEDKYRDDMIFMVLETKNALGRAPRLADGYQYAVVHLAGKTVRFLL